MKKIKFTALALLALLVVFITLKLTSVINWSWWWVTSPAWVPLVLALAFIIYLIVYLWYHRNDGAEEEEDVYGLY